MFSVITPSFNMLPYLKCASAAISDQVTGEVEHIVMDGGSTDGTVEWLANSPFPRMQSVSEPDEGMYDAINKGLKRSSGDILSYLNCDEQYLPGTLKFVAGYFKKNPKVDIIFGNALLTRPDGSLIAFRKGYTPRWYYILSSHLYVLSCAMFFRRRIIDEGNFFDTRYRAVGDADFVVRLLRKGYKARHIKRYFSAFIMTGNNLSTDDRAVNELRQLVQNAPAFVRAAKPLLNAMRLAEKFLSGAYFLGGPLEYSVYPVDTEDVAGGKTGKQTEERFRQLFHVKKASSKWRFQ